MKKVVKVPVQSHLGQKERILPPIIIEAKVIRPIGITDLGKILPPIGITDIMEAKIIRPIGLTDIMEAKGINPIGIPVELAAAVKEARPIGITNEF